MRENMGGSAEISFEFPEDFDKYPNDSGDPSLEQGTIVDGKFELQRPLNRRGFGNVWKARLVGNKVYETALTFIPIAPDAWDFFRDSKRIRGIFRSVRALKHRNIQSVYCLRHSETFGPYLVSQWIEGVPLDEFADEVDQWIIDAIKTLGLDTAKAVLNAPREMLVEKADLEEETVDHLIEILKSEFE